MLGPYKQSSADLYLHCIPNFVQIRKKIVDGRTDWRTDGH